MSQGEVNTSYLINLQVQQLEQVQGLATALRDVAGALKEAQDNKGVGIKVNLSGDLEGLRDLVELKRSGTLPVNAAVKGGGGGTTKAGRGVVIDLAPVEIALNKIVTLLSRQQARGAVGSDERSLSTTTRRLSQETSRKREAALRILQAATEEQIKADRAAAVADLKYGKEAKEFEKQARSRRRLVSGSGRNRSVGDVRAMYKVLENADKNQDFEYLLNVFENYVNERGMKREDAIKRLQGLKSFQRLAGAVAGSSGLGEYQARARETRRAPAKGETVAEVTAARTDINGTIASLGTLADGLERMVGPLNQLKAIPWGRVVVALKHMGALAEQLGLAGKANVLGAEGAATIAASAASPRPGGGGGTRRWVNGRLVDDTTAPETDSRNHIRWQVAAFRDEAARMTAATPETERRALAARIRLFQENFTKQYQRERGKTAGTDGIGPELAELMAREGIGSDNPKVKAAIKRMRDDAAELHSLTQLANQVYGERSPRQVADLAAANLIPTPNPGVRYDPLKMRSVFIRQEQKTLKDIQDAYALGASEAQVMGQRLPGGTRGNFGSETAGFANGALSRILATPGQALPPLPVFRVNPVTSDLPFYDLFRGAVGGSGSYVIGGGGRDPRTGRYTSTSATTRIEPLAEDSPENPFGPRSIREYIAATLRERTEAFRSGLADANRTTNRGDDFTGIVLGNRADTRDMVELASVLADIDKPGGEASGDKTEYLERAKRALRAGGQRGLERAFQRSITGLDPVRGSFGGEDVIGASTAVRLGEQIRDEVDAYEKATGRGFDPNDASGKAARRLVTNYKKKNNLFTRTSESTGREVFDAKSFEALVGTSLFDVRESPRAALTALKLGGEYGAPESTDEAFELLKKLNRINAARKQRPRQLGRLIKALNTLGRLSEIEDVIPPEILERARDAAGNLPVYGSATIAEKHLEVLKRQSVFKNRSFKQGAQAILGTDISADTASQKVLRRLTRLYRGGLAEAAAPNPEKLSATARLTAFLEGEPALRALYGSESVLGAPTTAQAFTELLPRLKEFSGGLLLGRRAVAGARGDTQRPSPDLLRVAEYLDQASYVGNALTQLESGQLPSLLPGAPTFKQYDKLAKQLKYKKKSPDEIFKEAFQDGEQIFGRPAEEHFRELLKGYDLEDRGTKDRVGDREKARQLILGYRRNVKASSKDIAAGLIPLPTTEGFELLSAIRRAEIGENQLYPRFNDPKTGQSLPVDQLRRMFNALDQNNEAYRPVDARGRYVELLFDRIIQPFITGDSNASIVRNRFGGRDDQEWGNMLASAARGDLSPLVKLIRSRLGAVAGRAGLGSFTGFGEPESVLLGVPGSPPPGGPPTVTPPGGGGPGNPFDGLPEASAQLAGTFQTLVALGEVFAKTLALTPKGAQKKGLVGPDGQPLPESQQSKEEKEAERKRKREESKERQRQELIQANRERDTRRFLKDKFREQPELQYPPGAILPPGGGPPSRSGPRESTFDRLYRAARNVVTYATFGQGFFLLTQNILESVKAAVELERQLARVQGILRSQSREGRNEIRTSVLNIASRYGTQPLDVLQNVQTFAQAGFAPREAIQAAEASVRGQIGLGLTAEQAQELLIAVNSLTQGAITFESVLDRIARVESTRAVSAQDLSVSLQRVGAVAQELFGATAGRGQVANPVTGQLQEGALQTRTLGGLDFVDLVSALTTQVVEKTRYTGSQAATSLRFILSRLAAPEISGQLQTKFGIKLAANEEGTTLRPLIDILTDIGATYKSLQQSGNTVRAAQLLQTVAGARQIAPAAAIFSDFDNVMKIARESAQAFGDTARRTGLVMETTAQQLDRFKVSLVEVTTALISDTGLLGVVNTLAHVATSLGPVLAGPGGLAIAGGVSGLLGKGLEATGALKGFSAENATKIVGGLVGASRFFATTAIAALVGTLATKAYRELQQSRERQGLRTDFIGLATGQKQLLTPGEFTQTEFYKQFASLVDSVAPTRSAEEIATTVARVAGQTRLGSFADTQQAFISQLTEAIPELSRITDDGVRAQTALDLLSGSLKYFTAQATDSSERFTSQVQELLSKASQQAAEASLLPATPEVTNVGPYTGALAFAKRLFGDPKNVFQTSKEGVFLGSKRDVYAKSRLDKIFPNFSGILERVSAQGGKTGLEVVLERFANGDTIGQALDKLAAQFALTPKQEGDLDRVKAAVTTELTKSPQFAALKETDQRLAIEAGIKDQIRGTALGTAYERRLGLVDDFEAVLAERFGLDNRLAKSGGLQTAGGRQSQVLFEAMSEAVNNLAATISESDPRGEPVRILQNRLQDPRFRQAFDAVGLRTTGRRQVRDILLDTILRAGEELSTSQAFGVISGRLGLPDRRAEEQLDIGRAQARATVGIPFRLAGERTRLFNQIRGQTGAEYLDVIDGVPRLDAVARQTFKNARPEQVEEIERRTEEFRGQLEAIFSNQNLFAELPKEAQRLINFLLSLSTQGLAAATAFDDVGTTIEQVNKTWENLAARGLEEVKLKQNLELSKQAVIRATEQQQQVFSDALSPVLAGRERLAEYLAPRAGVAARQQNVIAQATRDRASRQAIAAARLSNLPANQTAEALDAQRTEIDKSLRTDLAAIDATEQLRLNEVELAYATSEVADSMALVDNAIRQATAGIEQALTDPNALRDAAGQNGAKGVIQLLGDPIARSLRTGAFASLNRSLFEKGGLLRGVSEKFFGASESTRREQAEKERANLLGERMELAAKPFETLTQAFIRELNAVVAKLDALQAKNDALGKAKAEGLQGVVGPGTSGTSSEAKLSGTAGLAYAGGAAAAITAAAAASPSSFSRPANTLAYRELIRAKAAKYGLNPDAAEALIQSESSFNPNAFNDEGGGFGAVGLGQLRKIAITDLGVNVTPEQLKDPETNAEYSMRYLALLKRRRYGSQDITLDQYLPLISSYKGGKHVEDYQAALAGVQGAGSVPAPGITLRDAYDNFGLPKFGESIDLYGTLRTNTGAFPYGGRLPVAEDLRAQRRKFGTIDQHGSGYFGPLHKDPVTGKPVVPVPNDGIVPLPYPLTRNGYGGDFGARPLTLDEALAEVARSPNVQRTTGFLDDEPFKANFQEVPAKDPKVQAELDKRAKAAEKQRIDFENNLKQLRNSIGLFAGAQLGAGISNNAAGNFLSTTGSQFGTLAGESLGSGIGGIAGNAVLPVVGGIVGGIAGGLIGKLFGGDKKQSPAAAALERIERNTREQVTLLTQQNQLLDPANSLFNVPTGFVIPNYNPAPVGSGAPVTQVFQTRIDIHDARDPDAVARAVSRVLKDGMRRGGLDEDRRP